MAAEKLVYMANQIGIFFASQPGDQAAAHIAAHLKRFWDPRMREKILAYVDQGGDGLDPNPKAAVESLRPNEPQTLVASAA